jgi:hypothetical protein
MQMAVSRPRISCPTARPWKIELEVDRKGSNHLQLQVQREQGLQWLWQFQDMWRRNSGEESLKLTPLLLVWRTAAAISKRDR